MPAHMSRTPPSFEHGGPTLGQDNAYVFGELLNMTGDEIRCLEEQQVLW